MVLKRGVTPTGPGADSTNPHVAATEADGIPRHKGDGRPKIRSATDTAKMSFYARPSSFGKAAEDTYNLHRWELRNVAWGMGHDPTLVLRAAAVLATGDKTDENKHKTYRDLLQAIADEAQDVAKAKDAAARGTALHELSDQADQGVDLSHLAGTTLEAIRQWKRIMSGFRILASETFVVHDGYRSAGTFDRLVETLVDMWVPEREGPDGEILPAVLVPAGTILIVDLKTGSTSDYYGAGYGAQLAIYQGGTIYVHVGEDKAAGGDSGRRPWPEGKTPDPKWALIPHVPVDSPADAGLIWVDLEQGRKWADLAMAVRASRKAVGFYEATVPVLTEAPRCECSRVGGKVVEARVECPQHGADVKAVGAPAAALPLDENPDSTEGLTDTLLLIIANTEDPVEFNRLYDDNADVWTPDLTEAVKTRLAVLTAEKVPA